MPKKKNITKKAKILLLNPPCRIKVSGNREKYFVRAGSRWPFSVTKKREETLEYLPFPFYLAYTAALLEQNNFEVEALDSIALNQTEGEFLKTVSRLKPKIILFETSTPTIKKDLLLAKKLKDDFQPIICLAGAHATHFPEKILKKHKSVDCIFLREYEMNFLNFCLALRHKKGLQDLLGIAYRDKGQIIIREGELIDPLDQLPMPAWHLFPSKEIGDPTLYWDAFCQFKPAVQLHSSRGCPFRCNFCLWNQVMYQNGKYRTFSPKRIVDEMVYVKNKYGVREVYFDDDTFTGNKRQVLNLCDEILRRGLKINWSVMGDAMITDKRMLLKMARAGCIGMKFGVESGNQKILREIGKPINFKRIKSVAKLCAKLHIKTHATFTLGIWSETKKTMAETMDLAKNLDVDTVQFSINTPFPGTRFYAAAKKRGLLNFNSWEDFDGSASSVVNFENISQKEIEDMYSCASSLWLKHKLKDPTWVLRQTYNFGRLLKGQGVISGLKKTKRLLELITSKQK